MVLSASSPSALAESGDSYDYVKTQGIAAVLGIIFMLAISRIDYRIYQKLYKIALIASTVILLLVAVPGLGVEAKGATRWINLGFTTLQPSELAKIGIIIFYAGYLTKHKDELKSMKNGFFKPFIFLIPAVAILLLLQNHLSVTLIIIMVVSVMMLIAGTRLRYFLGFGIPGAVLGTGLLIYLAKTAEEWEFRLARITSFLNPWADKQGDSWQIVQSLYAIGSGGLFGAGLRGK